MKITFYTFFSFFFSFLNLSLQHKVTCICVLRDLSLPPKWPHPLVEYTGDNRECFTLIYRSTYPDPLPPTMATFFPGWMEKDIPSKICLSSVWANLTFSKSMEALSGEMDSAGAFGRIYRITWRVMRVRKCLFIEIQ